MKRLNTRFLWISKNFSLTRDAFFVSRGFETCWKGFLWISKRFSLSLEALPVPPEKIPCDLQTFTLDLAALPGILGRRGRGSARPDAEERAAQHSGDELPSRNPVAGRAARPVQLARRLRRTLVSEGYPHLLRLSVPRRGVFFVSGVSMGPSEFGEGDCVC